MPRPKQYDAHLSVRVSLEELAQLQARRITSGLSLSRYLVECALSDGCIASAQDRKMREVMEFELRFAICSLERLTERLDSEQAEVQAAARGALLQALQEVEEAAREIRISYHRRRDNHPQEEAA